MGFKTSIAWNHFLETEEEKVKCKYCGVIISIKRGNVHNMIRHLRAKHREIFKDGPVKGVKTEKPVSRMISLSGAIGCKRSVSWLHFVKLEGQRTRCKYCEAVISIKRGNIYNMGRHLKAKHPEIYREGKELKEATLRPSSSKRSVKLTDKFQPRSSSAKKAVTSTDEVQHCHSPSKRAFTFTNESLSQPTRIVVPTDLQMKSDEESSDFETETVTLAPLSSTDTTFLEAMSASVYDQINQQLVRMILKESHPLNIVENLEFRKFISMLNPEYTIPSRKTLLKSYIPQLYESVKEEIHAKLSTTSAISVTINTWTLRNAQTFLSVTANFISDDSHLTSALIDCIELSQSHTADDICRDLERIFSEWKIRNKISAVVTENTENIVAAVQKGNWCHLPCMTHSLNVVVQDALEAVEDVRSKCKGIVEFFKKSSLHSTTLVSFQREINVDPVELKQDVVTRWNSTYDMMKRILALKVPIESSLAKLKAESPLSYIDCVIIERACDILKIFDEVSAEISSEKDMTLAKELILISGIRSLLHKSNLKNEPQEIIALTSKLIEGINEQFGYLESNQLVLESSLLDPRFKEHAFPNESAFNEAYRLLSATVREVELPQELENPPAETSSSSIWQDFDEKVRLANAELNSLDGALVELDRYIQETHAPRDSNPLTWWSDRRVYYPRLYSIMQARLCIVPSVPSERVFTKSGMLLCEGQGKVSPLKMSQVAFLKYNLK